MARLDSFLLIAVEQGASDLHLRAGQVPVVRHDGDLIEIPFRVLSGTEAGALIEEVLTPEQRDELHKNRDLDLIYDLPGIARFRMNAFFHHGGPGAVFRIIPATVPLLESLALPPVVQRLCRLQNGLILVTGPTGSGKSTTLAAMVGEINRTQQRHILTIEDPIEYTHTPIHCAITQRQVGIHVATFAAALRSALREAPDVIVVGELRDTETIQLALNAAETGILVLATLHTSSAAKSVPRIVDGMPDAHQEEVRALLAMLLRGVISQQLVRSAKADGRIPVIEILLQTHAVSTMIRDGKGHQLEAFLDSQRAGESEMQSRDTALLRLARDGQIFSEDAIALARRPAVMRQTLEQLALHEEDDDGRGAA